MTYKDIIKGNLRNEISNRIAMDPIEKCGKERKYFQNDLPPIKSRKQRKNMNAFAAKKRLTRERNLRQLYLQN